MTTAALFNTAAKKLVNQEVNYSTLKLLLTNGYTFDPTDATIADIGAVEVSGNGWPVGGPTLANAAVTTVTTNDAKLDADDVSVSASGGDIGPATGAIIYDSTGDDLLVWIDFEGAQTAGAGTPFNVNWHANGIITFTYT